MDLNTLIHWLANAVNRVTWSTLLVFLCTIIVILFCKIIKFLFQLQDKRQQPALPPGPYGLPVIGNLLQLGTSPHVTLKELSKVYGDIISLKLGSRKVVCVNSFASVKEAASCHALNGRPPLYSFEISSYGGRSCIFSTYSMLYLHNKKTVARALHYSLLENSERLNFLAADEGKSLIAELIKNEKQPVNPIPFIKTTVINFAFRMTFGECHDKNLKAELQNLIELSVDFLENSAAGNILDFMPWLHFAFKKQAQKMKSANDTLREFVRRILNDCRDNKENTRETSVVSAMIKTLRKNALSDLARQLSEPEQEILRDEEALLTQLVADVFAASLETVAATLCWSIPFLVWNQDLQQQMHDELDQQLGLQAEGPFIEDRAKLPFLQATVLELLRLSTVLPFGLPHFAMEDTFLSGYHIPKDTLVMLNLWAANRDPKQFEQPDKFNPYRFLDKSGQVRQDYHSHYLTFSGGSRRCIGGSVAKAELFLLLGTLLKNVSFTPANNMPDMEGNFGLSLRPKAYKIYARRRVAEPVPSS